MRKLYKKIKSVERDTEQWFNAIKESNNFEFVRDNVEDKLTVDLTNQKLWRLFINYLKDHNVEVSYL